MAITKVSVEISFSTGGYNNYEKLGLQSEFMASEEIDPHAELIKLKTKIIESSKGYRLAEAKKAKAAQLKTEEGQ